MIRSAYEQANANLVTLSQNPYPGRGIFVGLDESGKYIVQGCWMMGRRPRSRNRRYEERDGGLYTAPLDSNEKVEDPETIFYPAMLEKRRTHYIVGNGVQTGRAHKLIMETSITFSETMRGVAYEPDPPCYTSRITAMSSVISPHYMRTYFSIVSKSHFDDSSVYGHYEYERLCPGLAYCLTTYKGDGDPPPSYDGSPYLLPILGDTGEGVASSIIPSLNADNFVALAVKFIDIATSTIYLKNKYERVTA